MADGRGRKRSGKPCAGPHLERLLWRIGIEHVAGVDEVGMGPLAGPVVAAAVVLPPETTIAKVADSKQVPVVLPVLGKSTIRAVTLQVLFTSPAGNGLQIALEYAYWVKHKGKWSAVWLPETYDLYKSGKCDTSQTRGLY